MQENLMDVLTEVLTGYRQGDEFVVVNCGKCDTKFAMSRTMYQKRRTDGETWYCPAGHPRVFAESTKSQLREAQEQIRKERENTTWWKDRANWEAAEAKRANNSLRATKGVVTRMRNRIKSGQCPVCGKHIGELEAHIKERHPGYEVEDE